MTEAGGNSADKRRNFSFAPQIEPMQIPDNFSFPVDLFAEEQAPKESSRVVPPEKPLAVEEGKPVMKSKIRKRIHDVHNEIQGKTSLSPQKPNSQKRRR